MDTIYVNTKNGGRIVSIPGKLSFDIYGNMYLSFEHIKDDTNYSTYFEDKYEYLEYQINIGKCNELIFDYDDYKIIDDSCKIRTKKIKGQKLSDMISNRLNIDDSFPDNKYFDSDSESEHSIDEDVVNMYGDNNPKFVFSNDDTFKIHNRQHGSVTALYDTCVYSNDQLQFISSNPTEESFYRMIIKNDIITMKITDSKETLYKLLVLPNGNVFALTPAELEKEIKSGEEPKQISEHKVESEKYHHCSCSNTN